MTTKPGLDARKIILLPHWLTPRFAKRYIRRHEKRGGVLGESQLERYCAIATGHDWDTVRDAELGWS